MNTIKTIVVVTTLLGVGYGAHVVLNGGNPIPNRFASSGDTWGDLQQAPKVDFPAMSETRPNIELPELSPTPLDSLRSNIRDLDSGEGLATGGQATAPLAGSTQQSSPPIAGSDQTTSLADFRRQQETSLARSSAPGEIGQVGHEAPAELQTSPRPLTPVAPLTPLSPPISSGAVQPASPASPTSPATNASAIPTTTPATMAPDALSSAAPAAPSGNALASVNMPSAGYVAEGVLPAVGTMPRATGRFEEAMAAAEDSITAGQFSTALQAVSNFYRDASLTSDQRDRMIMMLDELAGSAIYSNSYHLQAPHSVMAGETLDQIARMYGVGAEFLARVNGRSMAAPLEAGQQLKVVQGPFRAEVSLSDREITLFLGQYYAGRFSCAIGRDLPAQVDLFEVARLDGARPYVDHRTGEQIAAGAPENPYGHRWIELQTPSLPGAPGLSIHSCGEAVDASDTRGCISVSAAEADDLAVILSPGSRVSVVD